MATNNPFGKLKIERDDSDEEEVQQTKKTGTQGQLFAPNQEQKKKKKVRPEKKDAPAEDTEGFEVVGKKKQAPKKKKQDADGDEFPQKKQYHAKKEGSNYHVKDDSKPARKREFDRHSGTGRGREVAKGGAGGKGTWGDNPKQIAKNYEKNYDDYYINNALNPKEKKEKKEKEETEDKKEETTEQKQEENVEHEDKKHKKGEKKFEPKEIPEEEKLKIPEGAMSVEDFLKTKQTKKVEEKKVEKPKETEGLQVKEKEEVKVYGLSVEVSKKEKKQKEKKVNKQEEEMNQQVFGNLQVEDTSNNRRKYDDRRGHKKGGQQKKDKFHFNPDDFPEL